MGPSTGTVPVDSPTLDDLQLTELSPRHCAIRTYLAASFPSNASRYGTSSWLLLHGLQEGQRYEVRICWAATVCHIPLLPSSQWHTGDPAGSNLTRNQPTSVSILTTSPPSSPRPNSSPPSRNTPNPSVQTPSPWRNTNQAYSPRCRHQNILRMKRSPLSSYASKPLRTTTPRTPPS
jgi:hypothetical protein